MEDVRLGSQENELPGNRPTSNIPTFDYMDDSLPDTLTIGSLDRAMLQKEASEIKVPSNLKCLI
ncbi:unnamed protein product, partial [Citrullus colocynthis]